MNQTFTLGGKEYPVLGHVTTKQFGTRPLVDLPMMSGGRNCAGRTLSITLPRISATPPESTEEAVKWQRESIAQESEAAG